MPTDPKLRVFGFASAACVAFTGLFFVLVSMPNPLLDRLTSRVGGLLGYPLECRGVKIRFFAFGAEFSAREIDLSSAPRSLSLSLKRVLKDPDLSSYLLLKNSRWVIIPKDGGFRARLLSGQAGDAFLQAGFFWKDGKIKKFLGRVRVPADSLGPFSRLLDKRFPKYLDGTRVAKVSFSGGRWIVYGASGRMLEARWQ